MRGRMWLVGRLECNRQAGAARKQELKEEVTHLLVN